MGINAPSAEYRFIQRQEADYNRNEWTISGDSDYPGHYKIKDEPGEPRGRSIVSVYNESHHWRSDDELNRMGQLNEAYQKNEDRRLEALIEDTKRKFQDHASPGVASMWKNVFDAYA